MPTSQTRAFIHIQDTVRCIQIALENPPKPGERVQIFLNIKDQIKAPTLIPSKHRLVDSVSRTRTIEPCAA